MSFGWSAGDILSAINFIAEVVQALNEVDGAAKKFRDATSFLTELNSALRPLQTFTALNTKPEYKKEITRQVEAIRIPVEKFIDDVKGMQKSMGVEKTGYFRHFKNIPSKLKWQFFTSDKAIALQTQVEQHLKIIDTLMQRLTVDMIHTMQENFQGDVGKSLENGLSVYLPALQTTLLAELSKRDQSIQASWQTQLENLLRSYLEPQKKITTNLIDVTAASETMYTSDILTENAEHLRTKFQSGILNECTWPITGIETDPEVSRAIHAWWETDKSEILCIQHPLPADGTPSLGFEMIALAQAAKCRLAAYSFRRIEYDRGVPPAVDLFMNLVYSLLYQLCLTTAAVSTTLDFSAPAFAALDGSEESLPVSLKLLTDLLSLGSSRLLVIIDGFEDLDAANDSAGQSHMKALFDILKRNETGWTVKTLISTQERSALLADQLDLEQYVDASASDNFGGFFALGDLESVL